MAMRVAGIAGRMVAMMMPTSVSMPPTTATGIIYSNTKTGSSANTHAVPGIPRVDIAGWVVDIDRRGSFSINHRRSDIGSGCCSDRRNCGRNHLFRNHVVTRLHTNILAVHISRQYGAGLPITYRLLRSDGACA